MLRTSQLVISPGWRELLAAHGLESVDGIYRSTDGDVMTRSSSTEVRRLRLAGADGVPRIVFVKKYWANRAGQVWSGCFRGTFFGRSKARREFDNLGLLRSWGLHAPEPVACGEDRRARWLWRSCLISAGVPDPVPLDLFIRDRLPAGPSGEADGRARRRALLDALAQATHRLHEHHFVHHDYFWRNIILSGERLDQFWLIDAHKGRRWWWPGVEARRRADDLSALDAAAIPYFRRTERLRFLLRYLQKTRLDEAARRLLRRTVRLADPMREQQVRRIMGTPRTIEGPAREAPPIGPQR
jgi:tRNA A-37 threonylcarbamoyl transferase component Bud32